MMEEKSAKNTTNEFPVQTRNTLSLKVNHVQTDAQKMHHHTHTHNKRARALLCPQCVYI